MDTKTIVIVDDEEDLRDNLQDLLEFKGYAVVVFANGEDLLEQYDSLQPNLVLLDNQLPGIHGLELLPILKEKKPQVPVALVTASSQRHTMEEAEKLGADRFVMKPYTQQEMLSVVEALLSAS